MRRRALAAATALICTAILHAGTVSPLLGAPDDGDAQGKAADPHLFGLTSVVQLHIEIPASEYRAMQPPAPAGPPGGPPPAPRVRWHGEWESVRNLFGVEFPWAHGAVTAEGKTLRGVGLRYAGNASYLASASGLKRSFLIDLDRADRAEFHGLHGMQLQSGALDPTKAREALAFALFRAAGVPAPRTTLAEVTLTVPGVHQKTYLGLYTLVEPVDRAFLKDRFGTDKGLLVRPQGLRGLDFLGDDWEKYRGPYRPLAEPTPDEAKRLIEFVALVQRGDDEQFHKQIASFLDVDEFLRFMTVQALIANADGFFTLAYNYALFLNPKTNQFVIIPGDQELSFGNFLMMGSADQLMDMSLARPYGGENRLADRLLAIKYVNEAHQKIVKDLATTVFRKDRLLADVAAIEGATRAILEREAAARAGRAEPPVGFGPPGAPSAPDLRTFAEKRSLSIADQLAGRRDGYRPRFNCQREILRLGRSPEATRCLTGLASDTSKPLEGRVSALFALKQLDGIGSHEVLRKLAADETVREFALRALADRKTEPVGVGSEIFRAALADPLPRVQAQAMIALARLGDVAAARDIVPLTSRPQGSTMPTARPVHAQPDPDRAVPHLAVRALVSLRAFDACLDAIDGPNRGGALRALRSMHEPGAVEGLIKRLSTPRSPEARRDILAALVRLHYREADYDGSWWGIRPDPTAPYFDPREWECSGRIASVLKAALLEGDAETATFLRGELARQRVRLQGLSADLAGDRPRAEEVIQVLLAKADPNNRDQIGNMTYEAASRRALRAKGDAARGKALFATKSCRTCHTDADGQMPKGPHLVDIGKRYSPSDLVESILKPSAKIAQGYEAYNFAMADGLVFSGFVVSEGASAVQIRESSGALHELKCADIEERRRQGASAMPEGIVASLTPEQLADLVAYLQSLDPNRGIGPDR